MNSQDFRNLQEAYLEVVMNEEKKPLPMEKMKKKIGNIKSSMKSTIEKSANEVGMNPKRVKFPFSPDDREKYSKDEKRVANISKSLNKEETDLYDIILSHLLDEGYAETPEAAESIMVNMSEDWRESICEAEIEPPKERVGALTNIDIPMSEREAARQRTLAKAKEKREKKKD
jgi:hypothetical protein